MVGKGTKQVRAQIVKTLEAAGWAVNDKGWYVRPGQTSTAKGKTANRRQLQGDRRDACNLFMDREG